MCLRPVPPTVACVDRVEKDYISNPNFRADYIRSKSSAAAGLCAWVINIVKYFRIYQVCSAARRACSSRLCPSLCAGRSGAGSGPQARCAGRRQQAAGGRQ